MSFLSWHPKYSVRVQRCDNDHKILIDLINQLHAAMKAGKGALFIQSLVDDLSDYAGRHFATEEQFMERTLYPGLAEHKAEHTAFINRLRNIQREIENGGRVDTTAVFDFLHGWLLTHMQKMDQNYSEHLNAHGVY